MSLYVSCPVGNLEMIASISSCVEPNDVGSGTDASPQSGPDTVHAGQWCPQGGSRV